MNIDSTSIVATGRPMQYLPIGLFGSVMGLTGLSVAWRLAHVRYGVPGEIAAGIGAVSVLVFIALLIGYGIKLVCATDAVLAEFRHPIASNMFGTLVISLLLLPLILAPVALRLAQAMWVLGAVSMVLFAWHMVDRWLGKVQQHEHATPAWIVPVVGMLDVPLALPVLDLPGLHGVMVMSLAVGLFFAVPLFTLIMARLLFEPPLPPALQPTLLILLAPSAVGLSTYVTVTGHVDLFAECLYMITLFLFVVLAGRLRYFFRACPFRVGWWAVSFPLAACAIAALKMAAWYQNTLADTAAVAVLAFASFAIGALLVRTLVGIARGDLRSLSA